MAEWQSNIHTHDAKIYFQSLNQPLNSITKPAETSFQGRLKIIDIHIKITATTLPFILKDFFFFFYQS